MTDCLIGNLNHEFEELFSAVAEFTTVPAPLPYGRARISGTQAMEQAV